MDSTVILASGGINSTVAASRATRAATVNLLHVNYGQPAGAGERSAVRAIAAAVNAQRVLTVGLSHLEQITNADQAANAGTQPPSDAPPAVTATPPVLMPALLIVGVQWAARINASRVVCGASQVADEMEGEALPGEGRPDSRAEFFHVFGMMLESALPRRRNILVETPLMDMTRAEIVRLGTRFDAPLHLTWVCHGTGKTPCGTCPGCRAQAEAFTAAGIAGQARE